MKEVNNTMFENQTIYIVNNNTHTFSRGYTGHKHLDQFELINMNGRIFDPVTSRFLSPDPMVQDIFNSQNYNRYSYCLNNPLRYTDPSGFVYEGGNPNQIYQEDVIDLSEFFEMSMQDLSYWMEYGVKQREEVAIFTDYNSFIGFGGGGQGPSEFFDLFNSLKNNPLLADLFSNNTESIQYLEFSGTGSRGRSVEGTLTWYSVDDLGNMKVLGSWSANSGNNGAYPIPQGDWEVDNYRDRSKNSSMTRNDVGFSFDISPDPRWGRDKLRIHPDGERYWGTLGCIGLTGSAAELMLFRDKLKGYLENHNSMYLVVNYNIPIIKFYPD